MKKRKVLLIGWDAADWKVINPLMDAGKMPNVRRLVESGCAGQIATLHPPLSPMLWTSIATGKRPFKHGIHGFSEPTRDGRGIQPVTNLSRTSKAIWNILTQQNLRSVVIGWWPSHPAEPINGVMVSDHYHRAGRPLRREDGTDNDWPLLPYSVYPPEMAGALAGLRMHPELLTPEMIEPFIPLVKEIDQDKDRRLAGFMKTLCECVSIHSAATSLLDHPGQDDKDWDLFAVYYDAIDHFSHGFMKYHPPRQTWIGERDFELYGQVVNMAYQFHDQMLGTLLQKAGWGGGTDDVTVILMSDHGFHPDHLRPASIPDIPAGPAIEHRDFGILAISGPRIRQDELLHGPSLLDITPTILALFGLPVGQDMDGKVLSQAFADTPDIKFIPSWEDVPGDDGTHPLHTRLDPVASHEAMEQMIALGYIERPDENLELAIEKTARELRFNLGEAYQDDDRHWEAYELFSELHTKDRDEQRFAVRLFVSCQALGLTDEMRTIVDDLAGRRSALFTEAVTKAAELRHAAQDLVAAIAASDSKAPPTDPETLLDTFQKRELAHWRNLTRFYPPVVDYLKAQVLTAEKRYVEALAALQRVTSAHMVRPGLFLQAADLYLHLQRWREAREVYSKALAIDPDNAHAHLGMCRVALRRRRFRDAAQSALDALQRIYHYPLGHYLLGLALTGMKEYDRAANAFRTALSFNPHFPEAHLRLAALLEQQLSDPDSAQEHRRLARLMRRRKNAPRLTVPVAERTRPSMSPLQQTATTLHGAASLQESLIIVTGLPRSGTSMFMQMLAAGGVDILTDGLREPDEDNPRGYLEFDPVKALLKDSQWLLAGRGKAVKIIAPLLFALPPVLPCRILLAERDLDEILDSQGRMLAHKGMPAATPKRRALLRDEYHRTLSRLRAMLQHRPATQLLTLPYRDAVSDPQSAAEKINDFLGGGLDVSRMSESVEPALYRNRA